MPESSGAYHGPSGRLSKRLWDSGHDPWHHAGVLLFGLIGSRLQHSGGQQTDRPGATLISRRAFLASGVT